VTSWQEFEWQPEEPDPARERLCTGSVRIDCRIEGANFITEPAAPRDEVVVWTYNVERGLRLDDQLRTLTGDPRMPAPDILLLSEADRGCTRTGYRNVAREYARALGMCYVYGTEFVELPRCIGPGGRIKRRCEHGNAIVSRYPLGNVRLIRHRVARSWNSSVQRFLHVGEPRLGGRVALAADVRIGDRLLRLYSVHFESGAADHFRVPQVQELIEDAADVTHGVLIGGDMNVGRYLGLRRFPGEPATDPVTETLFAAGYADAHAAIPRDQRATTDSGVPIDLTFGRRVEFTGSGIGPRDVWGGLSDHLPVWARVKV
jgi:endonuclease/exonuclease/phosphatase family metal-dependent hydrolase